MLAAQWSRVLTWIKVEAVRRRREGRIDSGRRGKGGRAAVPPETGVPLIHIKPQALARRNNAYAADTSISNLRDRRDKCT
jgi:hypothetical protein